MPIFCDVSLRYISRITLYRDYLPRKRVGEFARRLGMLKGELGSGYHDHKGLSTASYIM